MRLVCVAAVLGALAAAVFVGCGEGEPDGAKTQRATPAPTIPATGDTGAASPYGSGSGPAATDAPDGRGGASTATSDPEPAPGSGPNGGSTEPDDTERDAAADEAERAYAAYVRAINERGGARLCELLPANAERLLRPSVQRSSCGASLAASIGYRDPRGYPVWERTRINSLESVLISRDLGSARLSVAILTKFADRMEPSVESDIAYLELRAGEWRLAKPTGALYRAIGRPELPPSVISPP